MATNYFLTLRPVVEIVAVPNSGHPLLLSLPRSASGSRSLLNDEGQEADLLGTIASLSGEAYQILNSWHQRSRLTTLLLLLSTGGVIVYMLYRGANDNESSSSSRRKSGTRFRRSRWKYRNWLWWIFGDDDLEESVWISGDYFGPSRPLDGSRSNQKTPRVSILRHDPTLLAPCPNCVRGNCKVLKHHYLHHDHPNSTNSSSYSNSPMHLHDELRQNGMLPPTSTPESADDEASDFDDSAKLYSVRMQKFHMRFFRPERERGHLGHRIQGDGSPDLSNDHRKQKLSTSSAKQVRSNSCHVAVRNPPIGKDPSFDSKLPSCGIANCSDPVCLGDIHLSRDFSLESSLSASGSMMELVKDAREVRRLIREASLDSVASDFSLGFNMNETVGGSTEFHFDSLQTELSDLQKNFNVMTEKLEKLPDADASHLLVSKSDYGLSSSLASSAQSYDDSKSRSRSPDLALLKRPSSHFWRVHYNVSDKESLTEESLEWESPMRSWHDLKKSKYKVALSSRNTSEFGGDDERSHVTTSDDLDGLEWDAESLVPHHDFDNYPSPMMRNRKWLPEHTEKLELDMESELATMTGGYHSNSPWSSRSASRRNSMDRSFFYANKIRLPPSGRSSIDRGSGDTPRQSIDKAQLIKSFGVFTSESSTSKCNQSMTSSVASDESGFMDDPRISMDSSVTTTASSVFSTTSALTLSPVHEAKEPNNAASSSNNATPEKKCRKKCNEEKLIVYT